MAPSMQLQQDNTIQLFTDKIRDIVVISIGNAISNKEENKKISGFLLLGSGSFPRQAERKPEVLK